MSAAEFARAEGFREGLQAALAMCKTQLPTEPWLGQVALDTFASNLRERIAAGGCPRPDPKVPRIPDLSRVTVWPSQLDDADTADVPEWMRLDCTHDPVCGLESECRDLQREEAAADRAEEKRDDR